MAVHSADMLLLYTRLEDKIIPDSFWKGMLQPVLALALVAGAICISIWQGLGLSKDMAYSVTRAFFQLIIVGFLLDFIFKENRTIWIFVAYVMMTVVAGSTAGNRAKLVPKSQAIATISILAGTAICMSVLVALKIFDFTPRYIIPISGMMVGNAMTVVGVTMKRLREDIRQQQQLIEAALALGATPGQAIMKQVRRSLTLALAPVLDNAKTMGLISLPGAMTGLIMGGASPLEAIQLQITVLNVLIGAATFSSLLATYLTWPQFFSGTYQLKTEALFADS